MFTAEIKELPGERQDQVAELLIGLESEDGDPPSLRPEQVEGVCLALRQADPSSVRKRRKRRAPPVPALEIKLRQTLAAQLDLESIRETIISENLGVAEKIQQAITPPLATAQDAVKFVRSLMLPKRKAFAK